MVDNLQITFLREIFLFRFKFHWCLIDKSALVRVMTCRQTGGKPLSGWANDELVQHYLSAARYSQSRYTTMRMSTHLVYETSALILEVKIGFSNEMWIPKYTIPKFHRVVNWIHSNSRIRNGESQLSIPKKMRQSTVKVVKASRTLNCSHHVTWKAKSDDDELQSYCEVKLKLVTFAL